PGDEQPVARERQPRVDVRGSSKRACPRACLVHGEPRGESLSRQPLTRVSRQYMTPPDMTGPPVPLPMTRRTLAGVGRDLRYGARLLVRQRGFTAVSVLTIALAVGVTTTLFSVVDAVILRPLPWPDADRLVRLTESHVGATRQMPLLVTNS